MATVLKLGTAQTLAWASTDCLPAMPAAPFARDLAMPMPLVLEAFSVAPVVSGMLGPGAVRLLECGVLQRAHPL